MAKQENTKERQSNANVLKEFCCNTTLHGVHRVADSKSTTRKFIWLFFLLVSTGVMFKCAVFSFANYLTFPHTTVVSEEFPEYGALKFPAVTFCPINIFMRSKIELPDDHPDFERLGLNLDVCKRSKLFRERHNLTCGRFLLCAGVTIFRSDEFDCKNANYSDWSRIIQTSSGAISDRFHSVYGATLKEILLRCKYGEQECSEASFSEHLSDTGKCFSFNNNITDSEGSGQFKYLFQLGTLELILNANLSEQTWGKSFTEGIRFNIHDQGTFMGFNEGFVVSPGSLAVVSIKQRQGTFLEWPYKTNCSKKNLTAYPTYTVNGCLFDCFNYMVVRECACRLTGFPNVTSERVCTNTDASCVLRICKSVMPASCDCRPPCSQTVYSYQLSTSLFPNDMVAKHVQRKYNLSVADQRKNLLAIQVSYRAMSYEKLQEKPTHTVETLIGEVGGNLGLMLGCSWLTVAEIIELISALISNWIQKRSERVHTSDDH